MLVLFQVLKKVRELENWDEVRHAVCGDLTTTPEACPTGPFLSEFDFFILAFVVMAVLALISLLVVLFYCARKSCRCSPCCGSTYSEPNPPPIPVNRLSTPNPSNSDYMTMSRVVTPFHSPPQRSLDRPIDRYPKRLSTFRPISPASRNTGMSRSKSCVSMAPKPRRFDSLSEAIAVVARPEASPHWPGNLCLF